MMTLPIAGAVLSLDHRLGLYADDAKSVPAVNAGPVAAWADQSGNGYDMLQTTSGYRPTSTAAGVQFDGVDDFLQNTDAGLAGVLDTGEWSMWLSFRMETIAANQYFITAGSGSSNNVNISLYHPGAGKLNTFIRNAAGTQPSVSSDMYAGISLGAYVYAGLSRSATDDTRLYMDGTLQNYLDRSTLSGAIGVTQLTLGANGRVAVSNQAACIIEHVGVWPGELTAADYLTLSSWAKAERFGSGGGGGNTAAAYNRGRVDALRQVGALR